jgi:hypothetical protein
MKIQLKQNYKLTVMMFKTNKDMVTIPRLIMFLLVLKHLDITKNSHPK